MTNYPVWWNQVITIYNKYEDPQTHVVTWYRTVKEGCFWQRTNERLVVGTTVISASNTLCRVRKDPDFLESYEWITTPNDKMGNYFTLQPGDIIVRGRVTDSINEYANGYRSSDIIAKYAKHRGCIVVADTTINVGDGRNNEHYLARGN